MRRRPATTWTIDDDGPPAADPAEAARRLKAAARALGFAACGVAPPRLPPDDGERLLAWLARGWQGGMSYMAQAPAGRTDAASVLPDARAVVMVALPCEPEREVAGAGSARGRVATYARGELDYHRVFAVRLELLARFFRERLCPGARARRFCDTTPLLERAFARAAGLGFVGKNTLLIDPARGSFLLLGGLALDRALPLDAPDASASCGTCTRCLEACPTGALPAPYVLDARACISYLTIEHRGPYAAPLREAVGEHVFGCDVCQAVCPWNAKFARPADPELAPAPERARPGLRDLAERALAAFKGLARGTPWERPGKRGFLRNVATAIGGSGDPSLDAALDALVDHEDEGVREHAQWARARLREASASPAPSPAPSPLPRP